MKEPSCYIEMRRRKLFEIFEMIKGCIDFMESQVCQCYDPDIIRCPKARYPEE